MSYSFSVRGNSKTEVVLAAEAKFKEMLASQPVHSKDEAAAFDNLRAHIALCRDVAEIEEVIIAMHGSIAIHDGQVQGCGSGCNVYIQPKS